MFYSIPVNSNQIITTSPLVARSITHVFFESKNDGIFNYKRNADAVTITIDGKMICRDVPVLPFTSSTTYGINRHKWQDVALEVGLNVNLSEIKISAQVINDFNVVFVCSNQELKDTKGFDFVECKRFKLNEVLSRAEKYTLASKYFNQLKKMGTLSIYDKDYTYPYRCRLPEFDGYTIGGLPYFDFVFGEDFTGTNVDGKYIALTDENKSQFAWESTPAANGYDFKAYYQFTDKELEENIYNLINSQSEFTKDWGIEQTVSLDRAPEKMFFYQVASLASSPEDTSILMPIDVEMNFTLSGTESQEFPPKTDMRVAMATDNIPWRDAVHTFGQIMPKTLQLTYDYTRDEKNRRLSWTYRSLMRYYSNIHDKIPPTWDLYAFFIYKKLI